MKKLQDLNLEELLQELETSPDQKQIRTDGVPSDVLTFLNTFNLKSGTDSLNPTILYSIYKMWSKAPIKKLAFGYALSLVFNRQGANVLIDESKFSLKREDWSHFVRTPVQPRTQAKKRQFEAFKRYFNLERGDTFVAFDAFYLLYDRYITILNRKNKMGRDVFAGFMRLYFEEKFIWVGSYFKVSDTIWNSINKDIYDEKEKNKKKRKKVPLPRARSKS